MRLRPLLIASALLLPLTACDKKEEAKSDDTKAEGKEDKDEKGEGKADEKVADKGEDKAPEDKPAEGACDAKKELEGFLDLFAAAKVDDMVGKVSFPFSGDGGRWVEDEEKFKEGFDGQKPMPFEKFDIKPLEDEAGLADNKKQWLVDVRGKYADVQIFDVAATVKDKDEPMTALWFVDGATCKVVGLDD